MTVNPEMDCGSLIIAENLPKSHFLVQRGKKKYPSCGIVQTVGDLTVFHRCTSNCSPQRTLRKMSSKESKCSGVGLNINLMENLQPDLKRPDWCLKKSKRKRKKRLKNGAKLNGNDWWIQCCDCEQFFDLKQVCMF